MTPSRSPRSTGGMPALRRGSMVPLAWTGLQAGLARGLSRLMGRSPRPHTETGVREQALPQALAPWQASARVLEAQAEAWQAAAVQRRRWLLFWIALSTVFAASLLWMAQPDGGPAGLQWLQLGLFSLLFAWIAAGCVTAVMGFWVEWRGDRHALYARDAGHDPIDAEARTAVIMPICNEDVATVFAGLRATCEDLHRTGESSAFDVFVLSDTGRPELRAEELSAWADLRATLADQGMPIQIHYRWRQHRTKRKSGNVADFCRRWGRAYRYMVVFDADSVMSGDSLVRLVRLMERHPKSGILQTAPRACGHDTLHARAQQFASRVAGRLFTAGMQFWQLGESHYWGHNAIIRVEPFMKHCGLAALPGTGALSGEILSHDFVEAALMRRAGYQVWLVQDLEGSYEQQPPHLLAELQRDRRWCMGNLQNARLIAEPGLKGVHRAMLFTGAMSYASAPLWLFYVALGTLIWALEGRITPATQILAPAGSALLWMTTAVMLMLPRILGVLTVLLRGEASQYGGALRLIGSSVAEASMSVLQAPVRMAAHSVFVIGGLTGWTLQWKSPPREAEDIPWQQATQSLGRFSLAAIALTALMALFAPTALPWLLPMALPLVVAIPVAVWTSRTRVGERIRAAGWMVIPEEAHTPAVLQQAWRHVAPAARAAARVRLDVREGLDTLIELAQAALGSRRTTVGLRGRARVQRIQTMSPAPSSSVAPQDWMRFLSEPHSLRLLQLAHATQDRATA